MVFHAGRTWGRKLETTISLYRWAEGDKEGRQCDSDVTHMHQQSGDFRYQAGPVTYKAAHRCVFAWGEIRVSRIHWADAMTGKFLTAHFCK